MGDGGDGGDGGASGGGDFFVPQSFDIPTVDPGLTSSVTANTLEDLYRRRGDYNFGGRDYSFNPNQGWTAGGVNALPDSMRSDLINYGGQSFTPWSPGAYSQLGGDQGSPNATPNWGFVPFNDPKFLQSIGYNGLATTNVGTGDSVSQQVDPRFMQFLQDKGLTIGRSDPGDQQFHMRAFDQNNNPVGDEYKYQVLDDGKAAAMAALAMAGGFGAGTLLAGAGAADGAGGMALQEGATPASLGGTSEFSPSLSTLGNYAKTGFNLYNTGNSIRNGDVLGAITSGIGAYGGLGGTDPTGGYLRTIGQGAGALNSLSQGNYLGAISGGMGAYSSLGGSDPYEIGRTAGVANQGLNAVKSLENGNPFGAVSNAVNAYNGASNLGVVRNMNEDYQPNYGHEGGNLLASNGFASPTPDMPQQNYSPAPWAQQSTFDRLSGATPPEQNYSPAPWAVNPNNPNSQSIGDMMNGTTATPQKQAQSSNPIFGLLNPVAQYMSNANSSVPGGANNMAANLMDMYNRYRYNQRQGGLARGLEGLYAPGSPYAQILERNLMRADAASGRRTQVAPRQVELQARLADSAARMAPTLNNIYSGINQNRVGMANDLYRTMAGGPNGGGLESVLGNIYTKWFGPQGGLQGYNPASDYNYQNGSDIGGY